MAGRCLEEVLAIEPEAETDFEVLQVILRARNEDDRLAQVMRRRAAAGTLPKRRDRLLALAELTYASDPVEAATVLAEAVELDPTSVPVLLRLAEVEAELGRSAEAIATYRSAIAASADSRTVSAAWVRIGDIAERALADGDQAVEAYRNALLAAPDELSALAGLVRGLTRRRDFAEAAIVLRRLATVESEPEARVGHLVTLGELLAGPAEDPEGAADAFEQALALDPQHDLAIDRLDAILVRARRAVAAGGGAGALSGGRARRPLAPAAPRGAVERPARIERARRRRIARRGRHRRGRRRGPAPSSRACWSPPTGCPRRSPSTWCSCASSRCGSSRCGRCAGFSSASGSGAGRPGWRRRWRRWARRTPATRAPCARRARAGRPRRPERSPAPTSSQSSATPTPATRRRCCSRRCSRCCRASMAWRSRTGASPSRIGWRRAPRIRSAPWSAASPRCSGRRHLRRLPRPRHRHPGRVEAGPPPALLVPPTFAALPRQEAYLQLGRQLGHLRAGTYAVGRIPRKDLGLLVAAGVRTVFPDYGRGVLPEEQLNDVAQKIAHAAPAAPARVRAGGARLPRRRRLRRRTVARRHRVHRHPRGAGGVGRRSRRVRAARAGGSAPGRRGAAASGGAAGRGARQRRRRRSDQLRRRRRALDAQPAAGRRLNDGNPGRVPNPSATSSAEQSSSSLTRAFQGRGRLALPRTPPSGRGRRGSSGRRGPARPERRACRPARPGWPPAPPPAARGCRPGA